MTIQWVRPPEKLIDGIRAYERRVYQAVHAVADYIGQDMANHARASAPWTDRTGNARSGLMYAVDGFGKTIIGQVGPGALEQKSDTAQVSGSAEQLVIVLGHTVFYGKYLELANGGRYAVVMATIQAKLPELERMLQALFRG